MSKQDYQKNYKSEYNKKNKIVTFPLSNVFYEQLRVKSVYFDLSVNSYAKHIVTNFLNDDNTTLLSKEKVEYINEYIRISRGIANNINQLSYSSNIGNQIDISILINSLKNYEEEFKKFIHKV